MITILAGGTGSIKVVRGIFSQYKDITVVSNVADNFWFNGLYVCPDIDTIVYGLSNKLDFFLFLIHWRSSAEYFKTNKF